MDQYLETLYRQNKPSYAMPLKGEMSWQTWRETFKEQLRKDLKGFDNQEDLTKPVTANLQKEEQGPGFRRRLVVMTGEDGTDMPAYLLIPDGVTEENPAPAVLALCGHGAGMTEIVGLTPKHAEREIGLGYQKDFGIALCQKGFVVLAPDMMGFGYRRLAADKAEGPGKSSCFRLATNLLMMGKTLPGVRVRDAMRCISYLQSLPFVQPQRLGGMGISGGGTTLLYTMALDERLKACVLSGSACTYEDSILSIFHCIDNFVPDLMRHGEMYDVIGLFAPRPLLIEAGEDDDIFPLAGVRTCYEKLKEAYRLLMPGEENERLGLDIFPGVHEICGRRSYDFLRQKI